MSFFCFLNGNPVPAIHSENRMILCKFYNLNGFWVIFSIVTTSIGMVSIKFLKNSKSTLHIFKWHLILIKIFYASFHRSQIISICFSTNSEMNFSVALEVMFFNNLEKSLHRQRRSATTLTHNFGSISHISFSKLEIVVCIIWFGFSLETKRHISSNANWLDEIESLCNGKIVLFTV